MAGSAANLGITGGLLGGLNKGAGAEALYGDSKPRTAGVYDNINKSVDLSDPAAMRKEAARLAKTGDSAGSLALYNAASSTANQRYTEQEQAKQVEQDAVIAKQLEADKGQIPAYVSEFEAIPALAGMAPLIADGRISILDAEKRLQQFTSDEETKARLKRGEQRQIDAAAQSKEAHDANMLSHTTQHNAYLKTIGNEKEQIKSQVKLADSMLASGVYNPQVVEQLKSGKALTPSYVTQVSERWIANDPQSIQSKQKSKIAYESLVVTVDALAGNPNMDQASYDQMKRQVVALEGQPASVVDVARAVIVSNGRATERRWPTPTRDDAARAAASEQTIYEVLNEDTNWVAENTFWDNGENLSGFVNALAQAGPALASAYGVSDEEGFLMAENLMYKGIRADFSSSAVGFIAAVEAQIDKGREESKVVTYTQDAAKRRAAVEARTNK